MTGRDRGYSLIEVLITLAVVGIFLIPLPALFLQAYVSTQLAGQKTAAAALAQDRMEECKADSFAYILQEILTEEKPPSDLYPYVLGRHNYFWAGGEEGGMHWQSQIHLLTMEEAEFEPGYTEILLIEVSISWSGLGENSLILASYHYGR